MCINDLSNRDVDDRFCNTGDVSELIHIEHNLRFLHLTDSVEILPENRKKLVEFWTKCQLTIVHYTGHCAVKISVLRNLLWHDS